MVLGQVTTRSLLGLFWSYETGPEGAGLRTRKMQHPWACWSEALVRPRSADSDGEATGWNQDEAWWLATIPERRQHLDKVSLRWGHTKPPGNLIDLWRHAHPAMHTTRWHEYTWVYKPVIKSESQGAERLLKGHRFPHCYNLALLWGSLEAKITRILVFSLSDHSGVLVIRVE